jgi:hypothetical protein
MKGPEPKALDAAAEQQADPLDHLARGLVGEGHREYLPGPRPPSQQEMGKPCGQHAGLAGARPGEHQQGAVVREHGGPLLGIEAFEMPRVGRRRADRRKIGMDGHAPRAALNDPRGRVERQRACRDRKMRHVGVRVDPLASHAPLTPEAFAGSAVSYLATPYG